MEAIALALLGLAVGTALSPLVTRLAAWPDAETPEEAPPAPAAGEGEAGYARLPAAAAARAWQTPVLALATAGVFAAAALRYDHAGDLAIVLAYAVAFLICAATDLLSFRVPNAVTYPAMAGALLVAAFMSSGRPGAVLTGGAVAGGLLLVMAIASRGGVGLGDVKLAAFAGLALGWPLIFSALVLTAIAGGVGAGLALLLRLRGRGDPLPYAPFIAGAAVAVLLWQGVAFHDL